MTKSIEAVRQSDGLWTVTTVETTVDKDVVCAFKDIVLPPPVVIPPPIITPPTTNVLFHDDFSSMNTNKSENGVSWSSKSAGSGDRLPTVTNELLFNGKPTLKFTFGGGPPDDDAWCEQRFKFDKPMPEVWIKYYRYYPSGLEAVNVGPKWVHRNAPGSDNNKILLLWGGNYKGYNIAAGIAAWESGWKDVLYANYGTNQLDGFGQRGLPSAPVQDDSTLGRWVEVKAHFKAATVANNDGVIQYWEDGTLKFDFRNIPLYPKGGIGNGFTEGYLYGWSNTGFDNTTHCYIADFKLSDKPI